MITEEEFNTYKEKIQKLEIRISTSMSKLANQQSEIGDYRIIKTYEARLSDPTGGSDPYDTADLIKKRNAERDKINEMQQELMSVEAELITKTSATSNEAK